MTFSIVARDGPQWGVAVASKFLAVGNVVPWAAAGAGAVATQAWANPSYGPRGLAMLAEGRSAKEVVEALTAEDEGRASRQVGVVDARGGSATHTGGACLEWAGGRKGRGYACQGNILAGPRVVDAMAEAFEGAAGDLAARLLAALAAGDAEGGDRRGRQSAAILVVQAGGGYGGGFDRMIDLRVDDHAEPVEELARLLDLWRLYFTKPKGRGLPVEGRVRADLAKAMRALGRLGPKEALTPETLRRFLHTENFEERELPGMRIDPEVLAWAKAAAAKAKGKDGKGT